MTTHDDINDDQFVEQAANELFKKPEAVQPKVCCHV